MRDCIALLFLAAIAMITCAAFADDATTIEKFDRQIQADDQAYNVDYIRRQNDDIMESQQRLQEQLEQQQQQLDNQPNPFPN